MERELNRLLQRYVGKYVFVNQNVNDPNPNLAKGTIVEITKVEYDFIIAANDCLHEYIVIQRKSKELIMNFEDIFAGVEKYEKLLAQSNSQNEGMLLHEFFIDINRRVNNFLASFSTLIYDFIEDRFIPKYFGKKSNQKLEFTNLTREWFDNNITYRFFVQLRDYSIHVDLPIQIVSHEVDPEITPGIKRAERLVIKFRKQTLLDNEKFRRKMQGGIDSFIEEFDLIPLLLDIEEFIRGLKYLFLNKVGTKYIGCVHDLYDKIKFPREKFTRSVGFVSEANGIIDFNQTMILDDLCFDIFKAAEYKEK